MNIIICGAGQVGTHAAEVLSAANHNITVIDARPERVQAINDSLDVGTMTGNCANADVLKESGAASCDLVVAATSSDEINLLTAAVAKGVGARKTIARVHHSAYFEERGLSYTRHLGIDALICPEFACAQAIASILRNPGALVMENFGQGRIEMQEFHVDPDVEAIGKSLMDLDLPRGVRLVALTRGDDAMIPDGKTVIQENDIVVLVGNRDVFNRGRKLFQKAETNRSKIAFNGGSSMAVWLARSLRGPQFSMRLFEPDRDRGQELANKLDWVTVLQADPTDQLVFEEERLGEVDAFISMLDDNDEGNILSCACAKSLGAKKTFAVVQRQTYMHLLRPIGVDQVFTPRLLAVREIMAFLDQSPVQSVAALARGILNVYRVHISPESSVTGKRLSELRISPHFMIAGIHHEQRPAIVPTADDELMPGDTALIIGRQGESKRLIELFCKG